jgi:hypothetical protein
MPQQLVVSFVHEKDAADVFVEDRQSGQGLQDAVEKTRVSRVPKAADHYVVVCHRVRCK